MTAPIRQLPTLSRRKGFETLRGQLDNDRNSFIPRWRELSEFLLPTRSRFFLGEGQRGERRSQKIINTSPTLSALNLSSGMMANVTSPAKEWFRLKTPVTSQHEDAEVKNWLHEVVERMNAAFVRSNLYNALPNLYVDTGVFATGCLGVWEDEDNTVRFDVYPVGSYWIANDYRGKVRVFMREFQMTVRQLLAQFGTTNAAGELTNWDVFSPQVKNLYENQQFESWVDVIHVVSPNDAYDANKALSKHKAFLSCYYEKGLKNGQNGPQTTEHDHVLHESGYDEFPILALRWRVTGEDVYGTDCPGMTALGDIKALQKGERMIAKAIDKMVDPPLVGPEVLRRSKVSMIPGDVTFYDANAAHNTLRPIYEVNPQIEHLQLMQQQMVQRIQRCFYEDLFLMLSQSDRRQITAREVDERHEEKLLALGPVLEQLNQDLLDPLINRVFAIMVRKGMIPDAPQALQGQQLKVEYISVMAQAQKMVGLAAIDRFATFCAQLSSVNPAAADKVNWDQLVDEYGESTGVPPSLVVPDDQVQQIRAQRQQAQQAAQMAEQAKAMGGAAKDLSQADLGGNTALSALVGSANAA